MSYPVKISGSGISFTLIGEAKQPTETVQEKIKQASIKSCVALKDAIQWVSGEMSQLEREFTLWVESDLVDVKGIFKKLALLEYCFGPLPTGHGAFENMVRVVNETLQKTLAGLSSPDLTITEDTTGVGDGHTNSLEFWSKGFYLNFYGKQMDPHRTLTTIIHEASHRFAKTKDSWGDNSYVDIKWDIYWQVHGVNIKGTAHRPKAERPKPGMGSTMYPPITEHDKGLLNADSYATFAVRLFEV